ncbi:MAG: hypothetical protein V2I39_12485, partial [Erythrobacter sp.]|nr:hypothetical protein [Erythrobacter sp.]
LLAIGDAGAAGDAGGSIDIASTGSSVDLGTVGATGGDIAVSAQSTILTSDITAARTAGNGGSVTLVATTSDIATGAIGAFGGDILVDAGGNVVMGNVEAQRTRSTGDLLAVGELDAAGDAGGSISITAGAAIATGTVSATGGNILLDAAEDLGTAELTAVRTAASGGSISAFGQQITLPGASASGGDITIVSDGDVTIDTLTAARADRRGNLLAVGSAGAASDAGGSVSVTSETGAMVLETVSATGGDVVLSSNGLGGATGTIEVDTLTMQRVGGAGDEVVVSAQAGSILVDTLEATGGDVRLLAEASTTLAGLIEVGSLSAQRARGDGTALAAGDAAQAGDAGGAVAATSLNGSISMTSLSATGGDVDLDAAYDMAAAGAGLSDASASVTIDTILTQRVAGAGAPLGIDAGAITIGSITASGGDVTLATDTVSGTRSGGDIDVGQIGTNRARQNGLAIAFVEGDPVADAMSGDAGGSVTISSAVGNVLVGDLGAIGGNVAIDTLSADNGIVDLGNLLIRRTAAAGGTIDVTSSNTILLDGGLGLGEASIDVRGGDVLLDAAGDIVTGTITALPTRLNGDPLLAGEALLSDDAGGFVDVSSTSGSLALGAVEAGRVSLFAADAQGTTGNIAADAISASGAIDVETLGGAIDLGPVLGEDIRITAAANAATAGTINVASITSVRSRDEVGVAIEVGEAAETGDAGGLIAVTSTNGSIELGAVSASGGDVLLGAVLDPGAAGAGLDGATGDIAAASITAQRLAGEGGSVVLEAAGAITVADDAASEDVVEGIRAIGGDVLLTAAGAITTDFIGAQRSREGGEAITGSGAQAGDAGGLVDIESTGATLDLGDVSATGGSVLLDAAQTITTASITTSAAGGVNGSIDVESTGGVSLGALDLGDLTSADAILLDTLGPVTAATIDADGNLLVGGTVEAPSSVTFTGNASAAVIDILSAGDVAALEMTAGAITIEAVDSVSASSLTATAGSVDVDADAIAVSGSVGANGGDVLLDAAGSIATGAVTAVRSGAGGLVDIESTGGGLALGAVSATGGDISLDAARGITATSLATVSTGDIAVTAGEGVALAQSLSTAGEFAIRAGGLVSIGTTVDAAGNGFVEAGDIELGGATSIAGGELSLVSLNENGTFLGDGGTGGFDLSDEELGRIDVATLLVDAGAAGISLANVDFTNAAGSDFVLLATTGDFTIRGSVGANGSADRVFQFGGAREDIGNDIALAGRMTLEVDPEGAGVIDLGGSTLDLRADNIAFGQTDLLDETLGATPEEIAQQLVSNPNSVLFGAQWLVPARSYVTVGNLTVSYSGTALFQNTAPAVAAGTFAGVTIGTQATPGSLTVNPTLVQERDAFALFGEINGAIGSGTALLGPSELRINELNEISLQDSRVNGCIISSGADCVTTIVGTTIVQLPRDVTEVLQPDDNLIVPFDPLIGTNNESLFSDAAALPDEEECERDEDGRCVE